MAILCNWNDEDDSKPFLRIDPHWSSETKAAVLDFVFRKERFEDTRTVSHPLDNDSSHTWLLMLAGNVQYGASVATTEEYVEENLKQPWEPVMWNRTDFLTMVVVPNKKVPSLPPLCFVHIYLQSDSEDGLFYFFVIRSRLEQLAEFGRTLFAELKALPGFDPETIEYYEKLCPQ